MGQEGFESNNWTPSGSSQNFTAWQKIAGDTWQQAIYAPIGSQDNTLANLQPGFQPDFRTTFNSDLPANGQGFALPDFAIPTKAPEISPIAPPGQVQTQDNNPDFLEGVRQYQAGNVQAAFNSFLKAAKDGDAWSQTQVGLFYEQGIGVQQDYTQAAAWYKAAVQNPVCDPQAMKNLGQLYEYGAGVNEDWSAAAQLYQKGAQLGNASAETALARAYQFGVGLPQDRAMAIQWQQKAIADGDLSGQDWLTQISNPTNFIGFRSEDEQSLLSSLSTNGMMVGGDPQGMTFHNNAERMQWVQSFIQSMSSSSASSGGFYRRSTDPSFFDPRTR